MFLPRILIPEPSNYRKYRCNAENDTERAEAEAVATFHVIRSLCETEARKHEEQNRNPDQDNKVLPIFEQMSAAQNDRAHSEMK